MNGYRSRSFEWNQILAVTLRPGSPWAVLDLSDGTSIPAMGIQGSDGARATGQVRELRRMVDALTSRRAPRIAEPTCETDRPGRDAVACRAPARPVKPRCSYLMKPLDFKKSSATFSGGSPSALTFLFSWAITSVVSSLANGASTSSTCGCCLSNFSRVIATPL